MRKVIDIYSAVLISTFITVFVYYSLNDQYTSALIFSFIGVIAANMILMIIAFFDKENYFEVIVSIFYIMFFIIAPVIQLKEGKYANYFIIDEKYVILSNMCNMTFAIAFICSRYLIKKLGIINLKEKAEFTLNNKTKLIMTGVFLVYFTPNVKKIISRIIYREVVFEGSQISNLIAQKFLLAIPLLFVFYYLNELRKEKKRSTLFMLFIWFVLLFICKNPLLEKRNAIGPIYLSIICFTAIKKDDSKRIFFMVLVLFTVLFPLSSSLTNTKVGLLEYFTNISEYVDLDTVYNQFSSINFDAFSNLNVTIEYVGKFGASWGKQFISALLFFVPRSIWNNKSISSGAITGNYLMDYYGFFFNNLSCPFVAEGYYNGGIIGVILFAILMSICSLIIRKWIHRKNYYSLIAWYIIIDLFFILRGDLMNAIAYLIGTLLAIYILPLFIEKIISKLKKH